jgi:hypothetical protein
VKDIEKVLAWPPKSFDRFADFIRVGKQDHESRDKDSGSDEADIDPEFRVEQPRRGAPSSRRIAVAPRPSEQAPALTRSVTTSVDHDGSLLGQP